MTVVRGIGPEPPPKKLGPPPMMSRKSKPWAWRMAGAGQQWSPRQSDEAKAPDHLLSSLKIGCYDETGHNWRDFASHGRVSAAIFEAA